jgi:hypothetical protein
MNYGTLDTPNGRFLELIASWRSGHCLLSYFIQKSNAPTIGLLLLAILQSGHSSEFSKAHCWGHKQSFLLYYT